MYQWIVFIHVLGAFGFMFGHGATAFVMLGLPRETNRERIRALIEVHGASAAIGFMSLFVLLITGVVSAFWVQAWGQGWVWAAIVVLVIIWGGMRALGSNYFECVQRVIGMRPHNAKKDEPDPVPGTDEDVRATVMAGNPRALLAIGLGGWIIILWLMMFKPF